MEKDLEKSFEAQRKFFVEIERYKKRNENSILNKLSIDYTIEYDDYTLYKMAMQNGVMRVLGDIALNGF